jgi:hypothetical protein
MSRRVGMLLFLATIMLLVSGCRSLGSGEPAAPVVPIRFHLESVDGKGAVVELPRSGVKIAINAQPVFTESDIVDIDLARVELGDCLRFQLSGAGARDLYRLTASHQGRRLVVFMNGAPLGARRIEGPFADGAILIFVELDDAALPKMVETVKKSSAALQKEMARR